MIRYRVMASIGYEIEHEDGEVISDIDQSEREWIENTLNQEADSVEVIQLELEKLSHSED